MKEIRRFVPTPCPECVVVVDGLGDDWGEILHPFVQVMLLTGHPRHPSLWLRLQRAWDSFCGRERDWLEFLDAESTDALIKALQESRAVAWGEGA